jgi:uncharacterized repeat protein (TIGR03843 family)
VVHADNPALAVLAGFDAVVNNADRKGSHVLPTADGRILGVDHGLCFHTDDKLRTILWGWAGKPLPQPVIDGIERLRTDLDGDLGDRLDELITTAEMAALRVRLAHISGRQVKLITAVDPSLIGGVRVEMDGRRYDNTIQDRLGRLRRSLTQAL